MSSRWSTIRGVRDPIGYLKDALREWGLEVFCKRYYGTYDGLVIDNKDPDEKCRIRCLVPAIKLVEEKDVPADYWVPPDSPGAGTVSDTGQTTGMFWPPDIGTNVRIKFKFGDPKFPVYGGGFFTSKTVSDTFNSEDAYKRGFRTKTGHFIRFDDDPDNLNLIIAKGDGDGEPTSMFISMDHKGNMQMSNEKGSQVFLNAEKNESSVFNSDGSNVLSMLVLGDDSVLLSTKSGGMLSITGKKVTIGGDDVIADANKQFYANAGSVKLGANALEPAVKGNKLMQWGLTHPHPTGAPFSPTLGSVQPLILGNELSTTVTIS
jgi:hypothetical protein